MLGLAPSTGTGFEAKPLCRLLFYLKVGRQGWPPALALHQLDLKPGPSSIASATSSSTIKSDVGASPQLWPFTSWM